MEEIRKIKEMMEEDRPQGWDSLPDIDLYMDQVVSYLLRQTAGGKEPGITSAMINNYVKDGLLPRASGKRYHKEHLVYLTAIGLMKSVLTVKDIKVLLDMEIQEGREEEFFEKFLRGIDEAFLQADSAISPDLSQEALGEMAMRLALQSCAAKTACEHLLSLIRSRNQEEDPKAKKEKEKEAAKKAKAEKKAAEKSQDRDPEPTS